MQDPEPFRTAATTTPQAPPAVDSLRLGWLLRTMGQDLLKRAARKATPEEIEAFQSWKPNAPFGRAVDPETKLLLVRLCAALDLWNPMDLMIQDSDPGVRWLVFKTMSEMDGHARRKRNDLMLRRAARWGQAFREGRAKRIPWRFEGVPFGTCDRDGCEEAAS